ncbi:TPA: hypothetical protein KRE09_004433 [Clostridioides difficile]|uniref:Uncharacterized protein n=1 Tax=Enterococcus durans TaxID=53345 RepID=A0A5N0YN29_9ENTE|nr:hypothetical protein [Enterococcus faecalis]EGP4893724.1 hypothetical protein [Enterococcus faecium]EGT3737476.1 hypothetical protein [Clostridioides difficile]EMF0114654.1 hypothetical protein [Enterococcus hirae]KAA9176909.1 hypothetical protein F6X86_13105 [Enterococcus durans]MBS5708968.1 hypothetical protein [Veillonella sp.]MCB2287911.1 hypothetical protein [Clostridium algidicarnis]NQF90878.1 hypothetical protein [Streptococcus suis]HDN2470738.1 hypothetical protein [Clostridioide
MCHWDFLCLFGF